MKLNARWSGARLTPRPDNSFLSGRRYKNPVSRPPVLLASTLNHKGFLPLQYYHSSSSSNNLQSDLQDTLREYSNQYNTPHATANVEGLSRDHIGKEVSLTGYYGRRSDITKSLAFAPLLSKDLSASVQLLSKLDLRQKDEDGARHATFRSIKLDVPVSVTGVVREKIKPQSPPRETNVRRNEDLEISVTRISALNTIDQDVINHNDARNLPDHRHLQIRHDETLRDALKFRSDVATACRRHFEQRGWQEIETPLLFKSTPEGAREFLVPTRAPGLAYALPQSPQQYKQILMGSGIAKYFQFARCFRDEDLRADRQPEFTQLDIEVAFATGQDVMLLTEALISDIWPLRSGADENAIRTPFSRLRYETAMSRYGSDKPDTRLGSKLTRIDHILPVDLISKIGPLVQPIVEAFKISITDEPSQSRNFINQFMDSPEALPFLQNPEGQPGIFIYDSRRPLGGLQPFGFEAAEHLEEQMRLEQGDVIVIQARKDATFSGGSTPVGDLRLALHHAAVSQGLKPAPVGWNFLWVTDFPLFSAADDLEPGQGGSAGLRSTHHPFTAPATAEDVRLLATDPASAKADHFDLVLNGVELGGGSRRIHSAAVQEYVLRDVLKMSPERLSDFDHLLKVLGSGCPPHAGIALGFDRLIATILGKKSIRDVIAFPKSSKGEDLLVKSPSPVTDEQLQTYHLQQRKR